MILFIKIYNDVSWCIEKVILYGPLFGVVHGCSVENWNCNELNCSLSLQNCSMYNSLTLPSPSSPPSPSQLHTIVTEEGSSHVMELYASHIDQLLAAHLKASSRTTLEAAYQKRSETLLTDDSCFKVMVVSETPTIVVQNVSYTISTFHFISGRVSQWKGATVKGCHSGRVSQWKGVTVEGCHIGRVSQWKGVTVEGCHTL